MANYPNAVTTFATRNAGDVIQPSHINTLQDEVAAIEDGLLNGTAPVVSSAATVASLTVSGKSTLTGSVTVAGTSTFAGNVTVSGALSVTGASTFSGGVTMSGVGGLLLNNSPAALLGAVRLSQSTVTLGAGESTGLTLSSAVIWVIQSASGSTATTSTITGINNAGMSAGSLVFLTNSGAPTVNIAHTGSSAASAKQIATPNAQTIALQTHETAGLFYDGTIWRVLFRADG